MRSDSVVAVNKSHILSQATARSRGLLARRELGTNQRSVASKAIASTLIGLPEFSAARTVSGYWPTAHEVHLVALWKRLAAGRVSVCLPQIGPTGTTSMQFVPWDPTVDMVTNRYGIPEPTGASTPLEAIDVIILPCSAIDDAGTRVGMGAGFYDRALECLAGSRSATSEMSSIPGAHAQEGIPAEPGSLREDPALLIGVAFDCQRVPSDTRIVRHDWDVGVDLVVTESAMIQPGSPNP
jgi:5,10-methenyltetrahydrofolate synthetase